MKKQIVLDVEPNIRRARQVTESNIYAFRGNDETHIIIKDSAGYATIHLYANEIHFNNVYSDEDLIVLVSEILRDGFTVFEFETEEEFAKWIFDNKKKGAIG